MMLEITIFSLITDEAWDVSVREQIGVVLRYVNKDGYVGK